LYSAYQAGDGWTESQQLENPTELLREVTREPEPLPELRSIPFGRDAEAFRERLAHELAAEKVPEAKALDMLIAGTEIFANAERHGGGSRSGARWTREGTLRLRSRRPRQRLRRSGGGLSRTARRESAPDCGSPGS
jgi:hypothetical protein